MYRQVYRAQTVCGREEALLARLKDREDFIKRYIAHNELMTLSVFRWKRDVFAYYESTDEEVAPDELFGELSGILEQWPGQDEPRFWVPMMDIYHACESVSVEHWRRKRPVERAYATVCRLKPEMLSSYIFYHYQYQEEMPGDWSKYASIYLHENFMFFYQEEPDGPEAPPYHGRLETHNTPGAWQELMCKHFLPWEDDPKSERPWREIENMLYL